MNKQKKAVDSHFLTPEEIRILRKGEANFFKIEKTTKKTKPKIDSERKREFELRKKINKLPTYVNNFVDDVNLVLRRLDKMDFHNVKRKNPLTKTRKKIIKKSVKEKFKPFCSGKPHNTLEKAYTVSAMVMGSSEKDEKNYELICKLGEKCKKDEKYRKLFRDLLINSKIAVTKISGQILKKDSLFCKYEWVERVTNKNEEMFKLTEEGKNILKNFRSVWDKKN